MPAINQFNAHKICSVSYLVQKIRVVSSKISCYVNQLLPRLVLFLVYAVICFFVFGCQYHCNQLPGKCHIRI